MLVAALAIPIVRTVSPCIAPSIKPKTCSTLDRMDDFFLFCSLLFSLLVGQRFAAVTLLAYLIFQPVLLQCLLLSDIRTVAKCGLPPVAFIHQVREHFRIMRRCCRHRYLLEELALSVHFRADFVAEEVFPAFLCPTGIDVFLSFLVRLVIPKLAPFTCRFSASLSKIHRIIFIFLFSSRVLC